MRDRLFTIIDGEPIITPPLVNIPAFKKLWIADDTDDKNKYKRWMYFIYSLCDYRSDYYELEDAEKILKSELFGNTKFDIPARVYKCMEEYRDRNCPSEQRSLESAINSVKSINRAIAKLDQDSAQMNKVINELDKAISKETDALVKVEMMKEKLGLQKMQLDIVKGTADLVTKIENNVKSIIALRDTVEKAMTRVEDNKDRVENFIVDEFILDREAGLLNTNNDN